ncbi:hypothetical protein GGU11DRAFT_750897 [Lentinula aff. detonsa]|nr:hypothetical protein GGU11DRAFT_750897 [Lentinula aff. detonsa]
MAKWIYDAQQAEQHEQGENSLDDEPLKPTNIFALEAHVLSAQSSKPYCNTLANLFGGLPNVPDTPLSKSEEEGNSDRRRYSRDRT